MDDKIIMLEKGEIVISSEMSKDLLKHFNKEREPSNWSTGVSYTTSSSSSFFFWWLFFSVVCWLGIMYFFS